MYRLIIILILLVSISAEARTWRVSKSGFGDFTVIQDAVDAAESGDTISIGPGHFGEFTTIDDSGTDHDVCVFIDKPGLFIIGSGPEQTTIGPYNQWQMQSDYTEGIKVWQTGAVVEGIKFSGLVNYGACLKLIDGDGLVVRNCEFEDSEWGVFCRDVYTPYSSDIYVSDCVFRNLSDAGFISFQAYNNVDIVDCEFYECRGWGVGITQGTTWGVVDNCYFENNGFNAIQTGANGVFSNNELNGVINSAMSNQESDNVTMENCISTANGNPYGRGFAMGYDATSYLYNNEISCGYADYSSCISLLYAEHIFANDNQFQIGSDQAWYYRMGETHGADLTHTFDLTHNWWGTTDLDYISEHILDGDDFGMPFYVLFLPLADDPTSNEDVSWGHMKALFR
jgi:hypothetical protein